MLGGRSGRVGHIDLKRGIAVSTPTKTEQILQCLQEAAQNGRPYSATEIARKVGTTPGSVRALRSKALRACRKRGDLDGWCAVLRAAQRRVKRRREKFAELDAAACERFGPYDPSAARKKKTAELLRLLKQRSPDGKPITIRQAAAMAGTTPGSARVLLWKARHKRVKPEPSAHA